MRIFASRKEEWPPVARLFTHTPIRMGTQAAQNNGMAREYWIDWMKVIGIIAVVWGHFFPDGLSDFIYTFNVPVFFVISGYLARSGRSMKENFRKVSTSLIAPYLLLALIKVAGFALKHLTDGKALWAVFFILIGVHSTDEVSGCTALWFVYTLIVIKLLFPLVSSRPGLVAGLALLSLAAATAYPLLGVDLDWAVADVLLAFPFFAAGFLLRHYGQEQMRRGVERFAALPRAGQAAGVLLCTALTYAVSLFNGEVRMFSGLYGHNVLLFLIGATAGTALVWMLSVMLKDYAWRGTRIIAAGTIVILTFHRELIHPLNKLLDLLQMGLVLENIVILLLSVLIVLVFIPAIMLVERIAPILIGRRKLD